MGRWKMTDDITLVARRNRRDGLWYYHFEDERGLRVADDATVNFGFESQIEAVEYGEEELEYYLAGLAAERREREIMEELRREGSID